MLEILGADQRRADRDLMPYTMIGGGAVMFQATADIQPGQMVMTTADGTVAPISEAGSVAIGVAESVTHEMRDGVLRTMAVVRISAGVPVMLPPAV